MKKLILNIVILLSSIVLLAQNEIFIKSDLSNQINNYGLMDSSEKKIETLDIGWQIQNLASANYSRLTLLDFNYTLLVGKFKDIDMDGAELSITTGLKSSYIGIGYGIYSFPRFCNPPAGISFILLYGYEYGKGRMIEENQTYIGLQTKLVFIVLPIRFGIIRSEDKDYFLNAGIGFGF